jgi:Zn-finger nucleic acid-binding protein
MICPVCKTELKKAIFYGVEVDYCPNCLGLWFEEDELRLAKDEKDKNLVWLDIDLWKNKDKFKVYLGERLCPACRLPLYEVYYGDSRIIVDFCSLCKGVWLDRGEFKRIIDYLRKKAGFEILNNYAKVLFREAAEILIGSETLREEIFDFLTVLKLLNYKLAVQYPTLAKIISKLPK